MSLFALQTSDLSVVYDGKVVLWQVDVSIPEGKLVAVLGPNGAGKSTFLKAVTGSVSPFSGSVLFWDNPYGKIRKRIAYVPQRNAVDWDFPVSVYDVVSMGAFGRRGLFGKITLEDREKIKRALADLGLARLADRQIRELSGGQQQKVFLARALVQEADLYLLDEPFAGIDMGSESTIMEILRALQASGKTAILVHHDLHSVRKYFDWVVLLNTALVAEGPTEEVFSEENILKAYGQHFSLFSPR